MRRFYRALTATLAATPPDGTWHGVPCPNVPTWSLVVVEHFNSDVADDEWDARPGVVELFPENWGQIAPSVLIDAFASWGAAPGDTLRQVFRKIRAHWPACRL